jgi:hypothetical protein
MNEMKYVVVKFEDDTPNNIKLFIFPKSINHDDFVESLEALRHRNPNQHDDWERHYPKPISAGFTNGITCYGKSETLRIGARKEDTDLLLAGGMV